jgi:hypothetical protein
LELEVELLVKVRTREGNALGEKAWQKQAMEMAQLQSPGTWEYQQAKRWN